MCSMIVATSATNGFQSFHDVCLLDAVFQGFTFSEGLQASGLANFIAAGSGSVA